MDISGPAGMALNCTPPPFQVPGHAPAVSIMLHLAVYPDGRVCISILHSPGDDPMGYETSAERWSPVQSIEKILLSVMSMLAGRINVNVIIIRLSLIRTATTVNQSKNQIFIILAVLCRSEWWPARLISAT